MPGYVIHLAVGRVYSQNNNIKDINRFMDGIIAPDLADDKAKSHYGPFSSKPDLDRFIKENGLNDSYLEGYFLHLVTDYLFYNRFLRRWGQEIYSDYNKLNKAIIKRFGIVIPKQLNEVVRFEDGKPSILEEDTLYKFIETVGKMNIRQIVSKKGKSVKDIIDEELGEK